MRSKRRAVLSILAVAAVVVGVLPAAPAAAETSPNQDANLSQEANAGGAVAVQGQLTDEAPAITAEQRAAWEEGLLRNSHPAPAYGNEPLPEGPRTAPDVAQTQVAQPAAAGDPAVPGSFHIWRDNNLGGGSLIPEPVTAVDPWGGVLTAWNWSTAVSGDWGVTFRSLNPYTIFPATWGGFCCDQQAYYDSSRDITIWILQYNPDGSGNNGLRLAVARGHAALVGASFYYWDLTPQQIGAPSGTNYDQPKVSRSSNFFYLSATQYGTRGGSVVIRISLDDLRAGGSTLPYRFLGTLFSPGFSQGATSVMYFAAHVTNWTFVFPIGFRGILRVYRWAESSLSVPFDDVLHTPYPRNLPYTCPRTGGSATSDWCQRRSFGGGWAHDDREFTGWVAGGVIGFLWDASQGSVPGGFGSFNYPYEHVVRLRESDRGVISEPIVWNGSFAFSWGTLHPNSLGDIAGSVMFGGGTRFEDCGILVKDRFTAAATPWDLFLAESSNIDPNDRLSGDYLAARINPAANRTWGGTCYNLVSPTTNGTREHYLWYGREADASTASASPSFLTFGEVEVGTSSFQSFNIVNNGPVSLTVGTSSITGSGDFAISLNGCLNVTLGVFGSCSIQIRLTPGSTGPRFGTVRVNSSAVNSPTFVSLSGTGVQRRVSLSPGFLDFGEQAVDTVSDAQTVTVTSTGPTPLTVSSASIGGGNFDQFYIDVDNCSGATLGTGSSCTIDVVFGPSVDGDFVASLDVTTNAPSSPDSVDLFGTGVLAAARPRTGRSAPTTRAAGGRAARGLVP